MEQGLFLGLTLGISASALMNLGKGIQKQKVQVLKKGREIFSRKHRRDFSIWLIGVIMTTASAPLYSASLKFTDKSSLVASLSGIGLVALLVYAKAVLKENLGLREIFSASLIILGTGIISYFDQPFSQTQQYRFHNFLYLNLGLSGIFFVLAMLALKFQKLWGFAFGLIAGSLIGLAMVLGDMALVKAGGSFLGQLRNIYVYLALLSAGSALTITQLAFFKGTAVLVVPTINSFIILTPMLIEYFSFNTHLNLFQYAGAVIIITGIIFLTTSPRQVFQN